MSFKTDRETFRDLEIFSDDTDSVYSVFNRTRTAGGRSKLLEIMQSPVEDIALLKGRRDTIRYFYEEMPEMKFTYEQLDMIEHYLSFSRRYLKSNPIDTLYDYLSYKINPSAYYYTIATGIKNIVGLLNWLTGFLGDLKTDKAPEYLKQLKSSVDVLIERKPFSQLVQAPANQNCFRISRLDHIFRHSEKEAVRQILDIVYELDVYECASEVVRNKHWALPEYAENGSLKMSLYGLFHPSIQDAVTNDVVIDEQRPVLFLTGPNMAGKSSFLKSAGLVVYLSHLGFPVPAQKVVVPVFHGLFTTINLPDNIHEGLSHYYSEVKRLRDISQELLENERLFIVFDELFRGTNVKDAYDASLLVLSALSRIKNSVFLVSTHIVELATELKKVPNIVFRHFDCRFDGEEPVFSYKLKEGVCEERLGMYIIKREGIADLLEKAARKARQN